MPNLKRWERPSEGPRRNDKSRQASARLRQIKKRTKAQMRRLREKGRLFVEVICFIFVLLLLLASSGIV
jgi:cell division septal protein FtsQ